LKVFLYLNFVVVGGCDTSNNDRNNVETQRKGIIIIGFPNEHDVYTSHENDNYSVAQWRKERLEANTLIAKVTPIRIAAIHICLPYTNKYRVLTSFYGIALKALNARAKIHCGKPIEINYKLQQYGKC
jgi:hypothetical protein